MRYRFFYCEYLILCEYGAYLKLADTAVQHPGSDLPGFHLKLDLLAIYGVR